ncbi:MAG: hypothetical protein ABIJ12_05210, partial [bacterium]
HFVPFASYSYKIAPLVAESVIKRPWVIAKYMALPPAIMALSKELYKDEMTEDDWKTLESSIPREVQRRQSFMIVPWKIKDKWYWFDYSYFLPWGNYLNAISGITSGDIKAPLTQFGIGGTPMLTALKINPKPRFERGPAAETQKSPTLILRKFIGFTGTGLAQPNIKWENSSVKNSMLVPIRSR